MNLRGALKALAQERMDAGRKALLARGDNEVGPYQSPMEDGMAHFHAWYRHAMGDIDAIK